jgi:DNA-directed RNA polymerase specialized sigma24 family protein
MQKMPTTPDPPIPSSDVEAVPRQVHAYAKKCLERYLPDAAEDIAQKVLTSLSKPDGYGDRTTDLDRQKYRLNKVRGLAYEERRKARTQAMTGVDLDGARDPNVGPETLTAWREVAEKLRADLKTRLEGDRLAITLVDTAFAEGVKEPRKQAKKLQVPLNDVRVAWQRIHAAINEFLTDAKIGPIVLAEGPSNFLRRLLRDETKDTINYVEQALDAIRRRGDLPERPSPLGKAEKQSKDSE